MTAPVVRQCPRFVYVSDGRPRTEAIGRVGWRFIAANNRPLGRSARTYPSAAECHAAASELHASVAATVASMLFDADRGLWTWTLSLAQQPMAVCVHPYRRRAECARALARFHKGVAAAETSEPIVRNLGGRALPEYGVPAALT